MFSSYNDKMTDNIQVAIRVRPLIKREIENNAKILWNTKCSNIIYQSSSPTTKYCFDRVFNSEDGNPLVYKNVCAPIIKSVMEGFNGTIFAYGQTSSGKTYTMMGNCGVIPCAINDIFDTIDNMPGREFLLRVSYMEIYNENINDLLSNNCNLKAMEDFDGIVSIPGLSEAEVKSPKDIFSLISKGESRRRVGDTQMNEKSSRSHAIFRMIIESRIQTADDEVRVGQLNLVDLAGSERSGQMELTKERFKEGTKINKSLATLTNVISQLSKGDRQYVSYRDSKLTRILQNSLGGNAQTIIICTITPATIQETQSTLNFASRAKCIKNKPTVNIISSDKALLKCYTDKIKSLTQELEFLQQESKKKMLEKELKEKEKQNEVLKHKITELKEKFVVSQFFSEHTDLIQSKVNRRETWCGGFPGYKTSQRDFKFPLPVLPVLAEEPAKFTNFSVDETEWRDNITFRSSSLDCDIPSSKSYKNASIQTEDGNNDKKLLKALHKTKQRLNTTIKEFQDLKEFTTSEKQLEVFEESFLCRTRAEDIDSKYDNLLIENTELKQTLNEMTLKIEDLKTQVNILQKLQESTNSLNNFDKTIEKEKTTNVSVQVESTPDLLDVSAETERGFIFPSICKENSSQTEMAFTVNTDFPVSKVLDLNTQRPLILDAVSSYNTAIENIVEQCKVLETNLSSQVFQCQKINDKMFEFTENKNVDLDLKNAVAFELIDSHAHFKCKQEIKNLKYNICTLKEENELKTSEIQHLESRFSKKELELKSLTENLVSLKEELRSKEKEVSDWRESASKKYDLYLEVLKQKAELQTKLNASNSKKPFVINQAKEIENMQKKLEIQEKVIEQLKKEINTHQENMQELEMSKTSSKSLLEQVKSRSKADLVTLQELEKKKSLLETTVDEFKVEKKVNIEKIQELEKKKTFLENALKEKDVLVTQQSSKFSYFKLEFQKIQSENTALKETINKYGFNNFSPEASSIDNNVHIQLKNDAEKNSENIELTTRCQKLKEDNAILNQKLTACKKEIRRLYEQNNESKIEKQKSSLVSNDTTATMSDLQTQILDKEKKILQLEKENKKYEDYFKSKGHRRVLNENEKPKILIENIEPKYSDTGLEIAINSQTCNTAGQKLSINQSDPLSRKSAKPLLDLKYDENNCHQQ